MKYCAASVCVCVCVCVRLEEPTGRNNELPL